MRHWTRALRLASGVLLAASGVLSSPEAALAMASSAQAQREEVRLEELSLELLGHSCQGWEGFWDERKKFSCKHLRRHLQLDQLRDCYPDPKLVFDRAAYASLKLSRALPRSWYGTFWLGIPYRYTLDVNESGAPRITVRIQFEGEITQSEEGEAELARLLEQAESVWEWPLDPERGIARPPIPDLDFEFVRVGLDQRTDFHVRVFPGEGSSLYGTHYYSGRGPRVLAHEIGHMMGLWDEYSHLEGPFDHCHRDSLMCRGSWGRPLPHHYYTILRRAFCP